MKKVMSIILMLIVIIGVNSNIYAAINEPVLTDPSYNVKDVLPTVKSPLSNVWSTVAIVVQFLAVGCVVFAGVRYMFASADQKADIKQGLIFLAIGAVLVFGAITVVQFIVNATNELI